MIIMLINNKNVYFILKITKDKSSNLRLFLRKNVKTDIFTKNGWFR